MDNQPTAGPMFDRSRPYLGQSHTHAGERGTLPLIIDDEATDIGPGHYITIRDIADAVLIGILQAKNREGPSGDTSDIELITSGVELWTELSKDPDFDPVAASQNAVCEIEKRLGIYPNTP